MKNAKYPIYDDGTIHISISVKNGKLGNIPQFNTLPGDEPLTFADGTPLTNIKGTCGNACADCVKDCYAVRTAIYHHNSVIKAWGRNTVILRNNPQQVRQEINEFCRKNIVRYFRFHTSGELENIEQLKLYCDICNDNPDIVFYIYTKRFDILKEYFLDKDNPVPENFIINLSEWNGNIYSFAEKHPEANEFLWTCNVFSYDDGKENNPLNYLPHCPAIDKDGHETGITCAQCRRCMKKGNATAVYAH